MVASSAVSSKRNSKSKFVRIFVSLLVASCISLYLITSNKEGLFLIPYATEALYPETKEERLRNERKSAEELQRGLEDNKNNAKETKKGPNILLESLQHGAEESQQEGGNDQEQSEEATRGEIQDHDPLNILLLYADDWTYKTLGAVNSFVKTPNIDELAANGVLFTHNCVTTSICMVSRATLYTGQYASRHKTYKIVDRNMYEDGKWDDTLFTKLAGAGYHVGMAGKWHHHDPPNRKEAFAMFRSYYGSHFIERGGVQRHITELNEEDGLEFLHTRPVNKPFALMVSFFATHAEDGSQEQYRPQNRSMHLYANGTVPIPRTATEEHLRRLPPFLQDFQNFGRGRWNGRYSTPELYQHMMKQTYRMATEVDTVCGNLVAELKKQGVFNRTLIIFTTDNGNFHGDHLLAEKCKFLLGHGCIAFET
jgi:membrane-anchored protein YejM (alkaline phosphatase superfamily)